MVTYKEYRRDETDEGPVSWTRATIYNMWPEQIKTVDTAWNTSYLAPSDLKSLWFISKQYKDLARASSLHSDT